MPRGGFRPGAGRPPGSHGETAKLIQQAADDGVLPLEVMLDRLRFYTKQVDELLAKITEQAGEEALETLKQALGISKRLEEVAAMAAPYCHPRQGNAIEEGPGSDFIPLAERVAAYERAANLALAGGNIVELAPK